jgi:GDSL-like Lipase/Acylhydrolase family
MSLNTPVSGSDAIPLPDLDAKIAHGLWRQDPPAATWLQRRWSAVVFALRGASAGAFLGAIALHPLFISRYVSSDGQLEARSRELLYALEGLAALAGSAFFVLARGVRRHTIVKERIVLGVALALASMLGGTMMMEGGLRLSHTFGRPLQASRHYFFSSDPLLGWRHRSGSVGIFKEQRVAINSAGLRDDELRPPTDGKFRILFLGDSQIFGDGVSHEDTFVEVLESDLAGVESVNAGVIGYGTDQQLLYYERDGRALRPDLTVVGLNAYDLRDNISTSVRSGYQKPLFELRENALVLTNVPVDAGSVVDRTERWLNSSSHLYATAARLTTRGGRTADDERIRTGTSADLSAQTVFPPLRQMPRALEVTRLVLKRLAVDARQAGGRFAVMFLPYRMDLGDDKEYRAQSGKLADALQEWGVRESYAVLDLRDVMRKSCSTDCFLDAMHFSNAGHRLVAGATRDWLMRSDLLRVTTDKR